MIYIPDNWYWTADDGRVYSSAAKCLVEAAEAAYAAWRAAGNAATPWPRDGAGVQTDAALQEVLTPFGLWVDLSAYAADKRWRVETGGIVVSGAPIATDDRSKTMLMGARIKADADPQYSVGWKTDAGFVSLTAAQIVGISDAVLAHVDACFAAEATVRAGIETGDIQTIAEIDAFAWPA